MFAALWAVSAHGAALAPADLLILVNRDVPISSDVAKMYQGARRIPEENILRLRLGESRSVPREQYRTRIALPVKAYLEEHKQIQCIVTTAGVPYVIQATPGTQDGAAVDNELAAVLREEPKDLNRWQPNPLFVRGQNPFGALDARAFQMVYISRLDGPNLKMIARMVDDALAAEAAGLAGPVFGDAQGLDGNTGYAAADASIRGAIDRLAGAGFPAALDMNQADWRPPQGGVGEQAAGAAFYVGWYSLQKFQDIFGAQGLARGAIAWHVASGEAVNIWDLGSTEWCVNLLRRGAAVTLGPVFEPYVGAFPRAELMVENLLAGRSVAESYWLSLPHVSWAMVLLGDPLYRPFAAKPKPALIARAYVGAAANQVLEKGQTSPMLVQIQCVGPAGSGTPALTASVEAERGLATASGMVIIPPLQAGQVAVLRVPSVTAANDATAMFRLRLSVKNPGETDRRIVLEGRTGFSKIAGLLERQTQMFISPRGLFAIGGNAGYAILTKTANLQSRRVAVPEGWRVAAAVFSPDEAHVVLTLAHLEQKRVGFWLADSELQQMRALPDGTQFLRWLGNDTILLKNNSGLARFDITAGTVLPVFDPPGWTVNTIIAGTAIQLLTAGERFAIREGAGEVREVLPGVKGARDIAVADDLSIFGALDDQKRLWVQHGLAAAPEIAAEHVEKMLWGPISRRVLVEGADTKVRVYDGARHSWIPLPPLLAAQWSPDEERLLYLESERRDSGLVPRSLSLLTGQNTGPVCDYDRIGEIGAIALTATGETAFLLAGPEGGLQIWMMALPRAPADKP